MLVGSVMAILDLPGEAFQHIPDFGPFHPVFRCELLSGRLDMCLQSFSTLIQLISLVHLIPVCAHGAFAMPQSGWAPHFCPK